MSHHEKLDRHFDAAARAAKEAVPDRWSRDSLYRYGGAHTQAGGLDTEVLSDKQSATVERVKGWVARGAPASSIDYRANLVVETPSGQAIYNTGDTFSGTSGNTTIRRGDYLHESTDPRLARQVGVVAAKRVEQEAQRRISSEHKAA